jgi:hypothetical protein
VCLSGSFGALWLIGGGDDDEDEDAVCGSR